MSLKLLFCPVCGSEVSPFLQKCRYCHTDEKPVESKYNLEYYFGLAREMYSDDTKFLEAWFDTEIKVHPLFDWNMYNHAKEIQQQENTELFKKFNSLPNPQPENVPKCPTCQSTNIKKISSAKKVTHGLTFGLLSKTARSQFECCNCGYKW